MDRGGDSITFQRQYAHVVCSWLSELACSAVVLTAFASTGLGAGEENVRRWGLDAFASSKVPRTVHGLTGVVAVAAADFYRVAVTSDGKVWAWGLNEYGQLGNGTNTNSSIPVMVSGLSGVVAIAANDGCCEAHSLAVKWDGTVWAWGANEDGQLGNGTDIGSSVPVKVRNLTGVVAVAAGAYYSLALKSDGTVWAWGFNGYGQFGNGNNTWSPVPVKAKLEGAVSIAVGVIHSLAATSDGKVWAWGSNEFGQLGKGGDVSWSNVPVAVSNLTGSVAVAGGYGHSIARGNDGQVWAWGHNAVGQLGNGTNADSNVPVAVSNLTGVAAIGAGEAHNLAVKSNGTAWAWGWNEHGQLGSGNSVTSNVAVKVQNLTSVATVEGGGIIGSLAVIARGIPVVSLDPAAIDFDSVEAGPSPPKTVTVSNAGDALLDIKSVTLTGINPGDFTKKTDDCSGAILMPGENCQISATFTPKGGGDRSAALLMVSNGPRNPHVVPLRGEGTELVTVNVVSPNGGERLHTGTPYRIEWTVSTHVAITKIDVEYSTNHGASFSPVPGCKGLSGKRRNCVWTGPGPVTSSGRIRVIAYDNGDTASDESDGDFNIVAGTAAIEVTAPNGGVNWAIGSGQQISWNHNLGPNSLVKVEVSRTGGGDWIPISGPIPNTGTFVWKVRGPATEQGRIRVSWTGNPSVRDVSNGDFSIAAPSLQLTNPNGGEEWKKGTARPIRWSSNVGNGEFVKIELSKDEGVSWAPLADSTASDGSEQVVLPSVTSNTCRVRVTWLDRPAINDVSDANFAIVP